MTHGHAVTRVRELETSMFAMSRTIFVSVPTPVHTLEPLRRKGNRPPPFETMESSDPTSEGGNDGP